MWEYQLNRLDQPLAEMVERYYEEALGKEISTGHIPIFRVIPVDKAISPLRLEIMAYDRVKELIRSQKTIALTNCICRKERRLIGRGCKHIEDTCLYFSHMARYYIENGLARSITVDEALDVLDRSEKDGLVHSPQNGQRPMFLCNCCGCCCVGLRGITQLKLPASKVTRSDYFCTCDPEACSGCSLCTERCQVNAVKLEDGFARIDRNQCIGCGLCISTCPTEALRLVHKPPEEVSNPPASFGQILVSLAEEKSRRDRESKS
jgi:ferredoxin